VAHTDVTGKVAEVPPSSGTYRRNVTLDCIPRIAISAADLRALPLDHRAGFLMWLIDGKSTVEAILDACPISHDHALAMLGVLAAHGVITLE
jgi:hypothetical protein